MQDYDDANSYQETRCGILLYGLCIFWVRPLSELVQSSSSSNRLNKAITVIINGKNK